MEKPLIFMYTARKQWKVDCPGTDDVYSCKCSDRNVRDDFKPGACSLLAAINSINCYLQLASIIYT